MEYFTLLVDKKVFQVSVTYHEEVCDGAVSRC